MQVPIPIALILSVLVGAVTLQAYHCGVVDGMGISRCILDSRSQNAPDADCLPEYLFGDTNE